MKPDNQEQALPNVIRIPLIAIAVIFMGLVQLFRIFFR